MARLPQPGSDNGTWGDILNDFLLQTLKSDGTIKNDVVTAANIAPDTITLNELQDGTISEAKLDSAVQTKLNAVADAPDWNTITNKPAVIAAGADQASARAAIAAGTASTKADVGLGNVDNTSDATKNSAAATLMNKTISGISNTLSNIPQSAITNLTTDLAGKESSIGNGLTSQYWRGDKSWQTLDKTAVGLDNVNNTSDLNKPISIATQTALDDKADLVGGVVPTSQIPSLAFNTAVTVNSEIEMLALTSSQVHPGDLAIRSDGAGTYILVDPDPSQLSSWVLLNSPTAPVTSVNSQTGNVVLGKSDIGLNNVDNTSDINKPISSATQTALDAKADLVGGVVPSNQLPSLSLTTAVTVADQAAMLALTMAQVQPGDLAIRTDGAGTFILTATDPSVLSNWKLLNAPTDAVTSVNGQTGTVSLAKSDLGLGNVDNTSDATKNSATATLTNKTLTSPKINEIIDTNGNKLVTYTTTASAVNYLDIKNNSATLSPTITATGSDSTIHINFIPKGASGRVNVNGAPVITTTGTFTLTNKTIDLASNTVTGTTAQFNTALSDGDFATLTGSETLTNKRITPRVTSVASSATPTYNTDSTDLLDITALATAITSMTSSMTGTPINGQSLHIRIKDNGSAQTIAWGSGFQDGPATAITTTVAGKTHELLFKYNSTVAKWITMAADSVGY